MKARTWLRIAGAVVVAGGLAWALWPAPPSVEVAAVERGPMRVTVEGPGKARVVERYVVAAPVPGHLERIAARPGDAIAAGEVVATVRPSTPAPLDERTRRELAARLEAARAAEAEALAAEERARDAAALANRERDRTRALATAGSVTPRDLDAAETAAEAGVHAVEASGAASRRAQREVQAARALLEARGSPAGRGVAVRAPAPGRVLRVLQESEGPVAAGTPLLEVGDPERIELRVELLTSEAVRVRPGAAVDLVNWGGDRTLPGRVRLVEPSAFTKVSALGVEEQRVLVLVDPAASGAWSPLSDGYASDARIVVAERPDALRLPAGALFRQDGTWAVFVLDGGRARARTVRIGDASGDAVEVLEGLAAGDRVLVHPGDTVRDGVRVRPASTRGSGG
ncbi:MAG TPA: efflux RND transporter periplasmic adaptor subunit [Anaeromyxobacteraceae bacterium]|nr:efflux RND transporter periplasmic adaptor subunit [Anaeromyxobacteraceae bacterium]